MGRLLRSRRLDTIANENIVKEQTDLGIVKAS